jgi:TonB C terminal
MRIPIATIIAAMLCAGTAARAQAAPQDAAQPASTTRASAQLKAQTPLGGVEVLTDTEGVDLKPFLQRWRHATEAAWQHVDPKQVNASDQQPATVAIRFKILPSGQLMDGGTVLEQLSGQTPFDKAVWQAIANSTYPPLPEEFQGKYLELRAYFTLSQQPTK